VAVVVHRPVRAVGLSGVEQRSSLYRPLGGRIRLDGRLAPVAHLLTGPSGGQGVGGACRSEGLVAGEHVPDRLGESAGEVDLGDLGSPLSADACLRALVAVAVDGMGAGVGGGLDQRPAQVAGPVLGERAAPSDSPDW
jgi:hypothetical protein